MHPTQTFLENAARAIFAPEEEPPGPELVFFDSFTDGNSVSLDGHPPDLSVNLWTGAGAATGWIQGNKASMENATGTNAVVDVEISDFRVTVIGNSSGQIQVVVRQVDASNHWRCVLTAAGVLRIQKIEAGGTTNVIESGTHTYTMPQTLEVICEGDQLTFNALGDSVTWDTAGFCATATNVGLRGGVATYDDFSVYTLD